MVAARITNWGFSAAKKESTLLCDPGNNPFVSSEQQSDFSILIEISLILFLIGTVIALHQLDDGFKKHPANMWLSQASLVLFCSSYSAILKIKGTEWEVYSQIIDVFRIFSGTFFDCLSVINPSAA
ncbi:hypothetical protein FH972_001048 [Carpinus fangiana]|uniref:Uncharacterized protein n=1 Tax=Carpinus fangiana TaxID=176857 RepID=A0A5N6QAS0_9ROSI|nr:hypothetical protein FH972_001048 [Carpinus fangiana]